MILQVRDPRCNVRRKYYPDGVGGWILAEELYFENKVFNPTKAEPVKTERVPKETYPEHVDISHIVPDTLEWEQIYIVLREMGYASFDYILPEDFKEAQRKAGLFAQLLALERDQRKQTAQNSSEDNARRTRRRAITRVYDYFNSNPDLNMFVTLTLSPDKVARNDYNVIYKRLSTWLENRVKRKGLKYILIPEYHADGENIHFHGVFNEDALTLVNSGIKRKGKVVYNIADYDFGFTTAIRISGDNATIKVARYMLKYITKSFDCGDKIGGRFYLHGGNLSLPRYEYANEPFPMDDPEHVFTPVAGVACCIRKHV